MTFVREGAVILEGPGENFFAFLLKKLATLHTSSMAFFALNTSRYRVDQNLCLLICSGLLLNGYRSMTIRFLVFMLECQYYKEAQDSLSSIRMYICTCAATGGLQSQFRLKIFLTVA